MVRESQGRSAHQMTVTAVSETILETYPRWAFLSSLVVCLIALAYLSIIALLLARSLKRARKLIRESREQKGGSA